MKILRAYYRWNLDLLDGLGSALKYKRTHVVLLGVATLFLLIGFGAPWWLLLAEAATFGIILTWDA